MKMAIGDSLFDGEARGRAAGRVYGLPSSSFDKTVCNMLLCA